MCVHFLTVFYYYLYFLHLPDRLFPMASMKPTNQTERLTSRRPKCESNEKSNPVGIELF